MAETHARLSLSDKAVLLVSQLKKNPDVMPAYNDEIMRACIQGVQDLYRDITRTQRAVTSGESSQECLQLNNYRLDIIGFVVRCCNAYLAERQTRIKAYRWKFGGVIPASIRNNLCEEECEFFSSYCNTLAKYQMSFGEGKEGNGLDLMKSTHPPKTLFMQVRVKENYGEFETSSGKLVNLSANSIHNLPRQDCEMLIKQGILELAK